MPDPLLDRPAAIPLDRQALIARFDGIRQFRQGGRRAPNKPLLLLYALARLKHDRQAEVRFNATGGRPAAPAARLRALGRQRFLNFWQRFDGEPVKLFSSDIWDQRR